MGLLDQGGVDRVRVKRCLQNPRKESEFSPERAHGRILRFRDAARGRAPSQGGTGEESWWLGRD